MKKGYNTLATVLIFCAAFILVVLGFQSLDVINITNGQSQNGGSQNGGAGDGYEQNDKEEEDSTKPTIEIKVEDVTKSYDGKELKPEDYLIRGKSKLKNGHYVELTEVKSTLTDCGEISSENIFKILDEDKKDVTEQYNLVVKQGKVTITPLVIDIKVKKESLVKDYDGLPFTFEKEDLIVKGLKDDSVTITPYLVDVKDAVIGEYKTKIDFTLKNEKGENITQNYRFDTSEVYDVNIKKVPLSLEIENLSKTYDGLPLKYDDLSQIKNIDKVKDSILATHTLELAGSTFTIVDAGEQKATPKIIIKDENGEDVTDVYDLKFIDGNLEILKKDLKLVNNDFTKKYDGEPFTINQNDVLGLLPDTRFEFKISFPKSNVGNYQNEKFEIKILDKNGKNIAKNFNFPINDGQLSYEIIQNIIDIDIPTIEINYNKEPEVLLNNIKYEINDYLEKLQKDFGYPLKIDSLDQAYEAGTYNFTIVPTNENYKIVTGKEKGEFSVLPLKLNITIPNKTYEFNQNIINEIYEDYTTEFMNANAEISNDFDLTQLDFDRYSFESVFNGVKKYSIDQTYFSLNIDANNYDLRFTNGSITVSKGILDVYVNHNGNNFLNVYDGSEFKINPIIISLSDSFNIYDPNEYEIKRVSTNKKLYSDDDLEANKGLLFIDYIDIINLRYDLKMSNLYKINLSNAYIDLNTVDALFEKTEAYITCPEIIVANLSDNIDKNLISAALNNNNRLCAGDKIVVTGDCTKINQYEGIINKYKIVNSKGQDVTNYYKINGNDTKPGIHFFIRQA